MTAGLASFAKKDYAAAQGEFEAALAIDRKLAAADPTDGTLQRQSIYQLSMLAALPGAKVRWSEVVTAWRPVLDKGALTPADQAQLDMAKQHAAAELDPTPPPAKPQP